IVKRPEEAFRNAETIEQQWAGLGYLRAPDFHLACEEHARLVSLLRAAGAEVLELPDDPRTGLDSLYAHDPVLVSNSGAIVFQMGKNARRGEGPAYADSLKRWGVPILGVVEGAGTAEAGDMIWLDQNTLLVGRGFRTNAIGVHALTTLLEPKGVQVIPIPLPYFNGPQDVLHLMSFMSLLDDNLAVVYRRLLPVPLFELLTHREIQLVDVPDEEYDSMGCNVLALSPRNVLMIRGNPITRSRLQAAGCTISEFDGQEICVPGSGGPTCLTRPILRG
ncbi:MAG TPA: arginine deiminase family protein, partial [Terriglobia bacterium]|nr:arginine deiminase family protein [Terriglobia bacterium]